MTGKTYMLNHEEELWEKDLLPGTEGLLSHGDDPAIAGTRDLMAAKAEKARDRTRVVTYRVPHNAAVQIYDYKDKKSRSVVGRFLSLQIFKDFELIVSQHKNFHKSSN